MFPKGLKQKKIKVNEKQRLTLNFLQKKEKEGSSFSAEELSEASTYPLRESLKAKLSRSEFGEFILKIGSNEYKAQNTIGISPEDYAFKTSSNYRNLNPTKLLTSNVTESLSESLLNKSIQAVLAAIEIYNKPDFGYREETFSILMVNAWEILLKAKIVLDSKNKIESLYTKDKQKPNEYLKSRSGNYRTISILEAMKKLHLDEILMDNLSILIELRDNSVHFTNENIGLNLKILEIGTANLRSYLDICKEWFEKDLSNYNFYIMPMSFFHPHEMKSYSLNSESTQSKNLIQYIADKENSHPFDKSKNHSISLHLETKFVKSKMRYNSDDPDAISVTFNEEDKFKTKFIWNFKDHLYPKLKDRYSDLKQDKKFWDLKKELENNKKFCQTRYLNAKENKGPSRKWYDPNILKEFDKKYNKKD